MKRLLLILVLLLSSLSFGQGEPIEEIVFKEHYYYSPAEDPLDTRVADKVRKNKRIKVIFGEASVTVKNGRR